MVRRLVIPGLPCPAEAWESFLGASDHQRVIPVREIFERVASPDPREMSKYITEQIVKEQPDSIVCHDLGVPLTLMSLLRLKRQGRLPQARVTIFNGGFRNVSLSQARQPFRMQVTPAYRVIQDVERRGGQVDFELRRYIPRIRALYRFIILYRMTEKLTSILGLDDVAGLSSANRLGIPIQIIASPNDPYLPYDSLDQLRRDLASDRFIEVEYGHFPYSIDRDRILPLLKDFES